MNFKRNRILPSFLLKLLKNEKVSPYYPDYSAGNIP